MKYDDLRNPHYPDFEQGREDASQTNPYFAPGDRTAEALAAYKAGFEFGSACMDQYLDEQQ